MPKTMSPHGRLLPANVLLLAAGLVAQGAVRLTEPTLQAFDIYVSRIESQMDSDARNHRLPALDRMPEARAAAVQGQIVAKPFSNRMPSNDASIKITSGLINHWFGAVFIPNATIADVRGVLQDYADYSKIYAPDVTESRLISRKDDAFDIFLRLHRQVRVKLLFGYGFPVEFNTNYHVPYFMTGKVLQVRSKSTRIAQVKDPKRSHTDEYPVGNDNGYLWRLYSYWRIYETDAPQPGVFLECEAVSLSRSVPGFVEKLVSYFTTNFPEESMRETLGATRKAVQSRKRK
jgi:hypothetical protein